MTPDELKDIDVSNLSTMDEKFREEIIKVGITTYKDGVKELSELLSVDFIDLLETSIYTTQKEIDIQTNNENYELCFFLKEIIKQIKKEYGL